MLTICTDSRFLEPLDRVNLRCDGGRRLVVRDGYARVYVDQEAAAELSFVIGGALGAHVIQLLDEAGVALATEVIHVNCETDIVDSANLAKPLLDNLHWTLESWLDGVGNDFVSRFNGKTYHYFVCWLRDHVHTLKGQKWFYHGEIKSAIELYADTQRDDGMVFDRCGNANPNPTWRDFTFANGDFIKAVGDGKYRMERIPVENDVEYLFLEGLYVTWKATGDDAWMAGLLDQAIKAVDYGTNDRWRWSEQYQLPKRGYTIDTWDFMHHEDLAKTLGDNVVDPDVTTFGVMHGDATGLAVGCDYLAEMLEVAGRGDEAPKYRQLAKDMRQRLDALAWNGRFYKHHVSEDPSFKRTTGVDEDEQMTLSLGYDLNRRIDHDKCVKILDSYQELSTRLPKGSPGEFYNCYPPFEHGFKNKWHYMNGGVSTIVAGEVAHGAFEHGREAYGYASLKKVQGWAEEHGGYLPVCLRGADIEFPDQQLSTVDLRAVANADFWGADQDKPAGVVGWTEEGENDLRGMPTGKQTFCGIDFAVIDPATNGRKACIALRHGDERYPTSVTVPVQGAARSLYIHQTLAGGGYAGAMRVRWADGEERDVYVNGNQQVMGWFLPRAGWQTGRKHETTAMLAWQGPNPKFAMVGTCVWGWNNPRPDVAIESLSFNKSEVPGTWFILGITASDCPVAFPTDNESFGIPDCWGSSAVVYALVEGLAGVKDDGKGMDKLRLCPRWACSESDSAAVCARYASADGYARYTYRQTAEAIELQLSAKAEERQLELLLPTGTTATAVTVDGNDQAFTITQVEASSYCCLSLTAVGAQQIVVSLG